MAEQDEQPAVDAGDVGEVGEQERHGGRSRAHDVVDAGVVAARDEASGNSQISTVRALADATEPAFAVGARVRSLVEHMKGMKGSVGVVAEAHAGDPPYYAVTFDGDSMPHKWLNESEIESAGEEQSMAGRRAGPILHRVMDIRAEAEVDGLIPIAISSDTRKVERFDWSSGERFIEVLDHSADGIDMSYARDGLPFLLNHDGNVQIGIVERVHLGKDRKLRGFVRMGNHPDAAWVEKDIRGGIRKKISVGYQPSDKYEVLSKRGEEPEVRLYRGWRPYEVSSVPVPADYDVGVARSAFEGSNAIAKERGLPATSRKAEETEMEGNGEKPAAPAVGASVVEVRDFDAERKQRNKELGKLAEIATNGGLNGTQMLAEALQKDLTPAEFADAVHKASAEMSTRALPFGRQTLSEKEQNEYSVVGAIRELADSSSRKRPRENRLEFEVSEQIARDLNRQPKGFYIPMALTADRAAASQVRASVTGGIVGTTSLGGVGVQTSVASLVEILRNSSVLRQAGIRSMDGLSGNVLFPRQTAANSWTWEGENPSTAKALSAATFDSFSLSPKTGYGATAYSKQLLIQSSFSVEQFETTMATNNALQGRCAYISTPGIRGYLKTNLKNTVSGADYLMNSNDAGLNGYQAFFTNQVKSNFTAGTSTTICHGVVFGNWAEGIVATWGDAIDLVVDPYNYVTQGMVQVVESVMVDYGWRHPKSFVVATSALTS